ncbi:MAG TPA: hemerythrin domain-containing protein [Syntrophorhabdaceae bacterium]|jgi:hemerythrin
MALMAWNDNMSVNIKLVDGQHMKLVELLNEFHDAVKAGSARGHRHEHQALTKRTREINQRFIKGDIVTNSETLIFLRDWLTTHILGSDKKYGPFLNSKGVY